MEVITVIAILVSPLIAVQATQWLNNKKEAKKRKNYLFGHLMATRANQASPIHVEALNRIDIEFYSKNNKFKNVLDSWKIYHDHLFDPDIKDNQDKTVWKVWSDKGQDLLIDLLFEMSQALGYNFDKVQLKRGHYSPVIHGLIETEKSIVRKGFAEIFAGNTAFPIWIKAQQPTKTEKELS